jgi:hypothetical protein
MLPQYDVANYARGAARRMGSELLKVAVRWAGATGTILLLVGAAQGQQLAAIPQPPDSEVQQPADPLLQLVDDAIQRTTMRYLDVDVHTPWQIAHGVLALRKDYELKSRGRKINAIEYISNQAMYQGEYWFEKTPHGGRGHPFTVPYAFEGHVNQFLAILTMSDLPLDHQFRVKDGQVVTMAEMVRHAQMFANTQEETTWTLWFLTRYVEPDATWINQAREAWSMERLVTIQTNATVTNAPCGGTHQLFALSLARNSYMQKYGRLTGAWLQADQKIQSHIAAAQSLQNRDGTFSTQFFKGRGESSEFNERIKSSGHMLEWLMAALPERRLKEYWVRHAVEAVARDLINNANQPADCGPLYHAMHSLVLYRERVTPKSPQPPAELVTTEPAQPIPQPVEEPAPMTAESLPLIELQTGTLEDTIGLPPPPPSSLRNSARSEPVDIDEAHPGGVAQPEFEVEPPPPLPPREAKPLIAPGAGSDS